MLEEGCGADMYGSGGHNGNERQGVAPSGNWCLPPQIASEFGIMNTIGKLGISACQ